MLFFSLVFCFIGALFLSHEKVVRSLFGAILFPIFVELTSFLENFVKIDNADMLVISLFGGILYGFGLGLIMKSGFTLGGTDFLTQIVNKYFKVTYSGRSYSINFDINIPKYKDLPLQKELADLSLQIVAKKKKYSDLIDQIQNVYLKLLRSLNK